MEQTEQAEITMLPEREAEPLPHERAPEREAEGEAALGLALAAAVLPSAPGNAALGRELRMVGLVGLPLVAAVWGASLRMPMGAALDRWPPPAPLILAVLGVCVAGWLALTWLLLAPVGELRRWYALASDPRERRAAIWAGLRGDPRWRARARLWLGVTVLAVTLPAFPAFPARATVLALLPLLLALPGMVVVWLHARAAPRWLPALWLGMVILLALALALAALGSVA